MSNANTIQQRLQDLISTTPNLTLDEISAIDDACNLIDELTTGRDDIAYRYNTASNLTTSALDALSKALTERDVLMDSARLALGALTEFGMWWEDEDEPKRLSAPAIEALKKAGSEMKPHIKKEWSLIDCCYLWFCRGQGFVGMGYTASEACWSWRYVVQKRKAVL